MAVKVTKGTSADPQVFKSCRLIHAARPHPYNVHEGPSIPVALDGDYYWIELSKMIHSCCLLYRLETKISNRISDPYHCCKFLTVIYHHY